MLLRANPALGWAISALTALVMGTLVGNQPGNDIPWQVVNIIALIVLVFGVALRMALPVIGVVWASTVLLFVAYMPPARSWYGRWCSPRWSRSRC